MFGCLETKKICFTPILFESMFAVNYLLPPLLGVLAEKCDEPTSQSPRYPDGSANYPCQSCVHRATVAGTGV